MNLIRNLKTETVHRPDCSTSGADTGKWTYAVGKRLAEIRQATRVYPWLHLCRICMPGVCRCGRCRYIITERRPTP